MLLYNIYDLTRIEHDSKEKSESFYYKRFRSKFFIKKNETFYGEVTYY